MAGWKNKKLAIFLSKAVGYKKSEVSILEPVILPKAIFRIYTIRNEVIFAAAQSLLLSTELAERWRSAERLAQK